MASESADGALSPPVSSFLICGKIWKLGDPIHSIGIGVIEKKKWSILSAIHSLLQEPKESFWD